MQHRKQQGITFIGFLIVATLVSALALLAFRITPAYLEHFSIVQALNGMEQNVQLSSNNLEARQEIRKAVQRRLDVNNVSAITSNDLIIVPERDGYEVTANYKISVNIIANLDILLHFNDSVKVKRSGY